MGKKRGKACRKAFDTNKDNKPDHRSAEATLRRQETRVTTTVVTDLREALSLAPWTDQVHPRPASSWHAAAHLALTAASASGVDPALSAELRTSQGAPADSQSAPDPDSQPGQSVTLLELLHTGIGL